MNRERLIQLLNDAGVSPNLYSLYGDLMSDRIILYENYNQWEVFYLDERGGRTLLKKCRNEEEACYFILQFLVEGMLTEESVFFSCSPIITPHSIAVKREFGLLEFVMRIWFDSIIKSESDWSNSVGDVLFEIKRDVKHKQNYLIHLYGCKDVDDSIGQIVFTVNYIPLYDWISIKSGKNEKDFVDDFRNILRKCLCNNMFKDKTVYVGFANSIQKM